PLSWRVTERCTFVSHASSTAMPYFCSTACFGKSWKVHMPSSADAEDDAATASSTRVDLRIIVIVSRMFDAMQAERSFLDCRVAARRANANAACMQVGRELAVIRPMRPQADA